MRNKEAILKAISKVIEVSKVWLSISDIACMTDLPQDIVTPIVRNMVANKQVRMAYDSGFENDPSTWLVATK